MEISALSVVEAIGSTSEEFGQLGPDDEFVDVDIDSLALVEAAVILSTRFGARVDEFELADAGSARAVAALLTERLAFQPAG